MAEPNSSWSRCFWSAVMNEECSSAAASVGDSLTRSKSSMSAVMPSAERCRAIGTKYSAEQFLFCTIASQTPGLSARCFPAYAKSAGIAFSRFRASTNVSVGCERMACCARSETISSASPASTARISARSGGERCAPPAQTAIFRSRAARPARRSSSISGLRGSTGCLPQVFLGQDYCTGGSGSSNGRHGSPVQFQQHRGRVADGHFKLLGSGKMMRFSGRNLGVECYFTVGKNTHARGCGSGNGEVQRESGRANRRIRRRSSSRCWCRCSSSGLRRRGQKRGGGSLSRGAPRGIPPTAINTARNESAKYSEQCQHSKYGKPDGRARKFVLVRLRSRHALVAARKVIFGKQIFFVEPQKTGDGPHKAAVENATGEFVP